MEKENVLTAIYKEVSAKVGGVVPILVCLFAGSVITTMIIIRWDLQTTAWIGCVSVGSISGCLLIAVLVRWYKDLPPYGAGKEQKLISPLPRKKMSPVEEKPLLDTKPLTLDTKPLTLDTKPLTTLSTPTDLDALLGKYTSGNLFAKPIKLLPADTAGTNHSSSSTEGPIQPSVPPSRLSTKAQSPDRELPPGSAVKKPPLESEEEKNKNFFLGQIEKEDDFKKIIHQVFSGLSLPKHSPDSELGLRIGAMQRQGYLQSRSVYPFYVVSEPYKTYYMVYLSNKRGVNTGPLPVEPPIERRPVND